MGHIELARWADRMLIAPASADFMARMAQGVANDLLSTVYLACPSPVAIAPAMNTNMWQHPAVQHNLSVLEGRGVRVLGPASGEQACGDKGFGRMLEPMEILATLKKELQSMPFASKKVLVTAGPTHEAIDPVRFIGNRSSGKMGYALARAFQEKGADVLLVSGPVSLASPPGVERIEVQTALQMYEAVFENIHAVDIFAGCAAVADYRPEHASEQKIKKSADKMDITLVRNPDILAEVAALEDGPFTLGFAAETEKLIENARAKLQAKQLDMLAANRVGEGMGFERDENSLRVIWSAGEEQLPVQDKQLLAEALVDLLANRYQANE